MNIKKLLIEAGKLARDIAKFEAKKAKKKATAAVKKEAKRQVKATKKQARSFVGWPKPKRKPKAKVTK